MKTIVIPTDFSKPAENAASYALHVAKYLKSNLVLCHAFIIPVDVTVAGQVVWPLYDYDSILNDSTLRLDACSKALEQEAKSLEFPTAFSPVVEYSTEASGVVDLVKKLMSQKEASLVITGMSGAGAVTRFFTGSTSRALIEKANFPVLLIPPDCKFKAIKKIAFATDLDTGDIEVLHALAGFARYFDAELVVVHVESDPAKYDAKKSDAFLNEVTCKINYDKIYYREVNSNSVNDGLQWLSEHGWVDLLVMVHRHNNFMGRLIKGSFTKQQAGSIKIPLLVLPEGLTPVF